VKSSSKFAVIGLSLTLGACSVLQSDKVDYKSAGKAPTLDVPPDLTQLSKETRYAVPGTPVTASSFQTSPTPIAQGPSVAATQTGDVHIEREGNQRWLVVNRAPDQLWDPVKDFWQESGFLLTMDQSNLGIMETDWAENRAKIPQDFIRETLGKVFDGLYSTGERDKFRTRLERNAAGGTDIFISHRGMVEVYSDSKKDQTVWQPRAADPELEAEFLRRLMLKLGVSQERAKALVAAGSVPQGATVVQVSGQPTLELKDNFDRAWRRVGLSLDRTNFTVEDRDRSKGLYFVRFVPLVAEKPEPGFFSRLFSSSKPEAAPKKYRVAVTAQGEQTRVSVQNADASVADATEAERIIKVLAEDLK
jgi:outer membrane protein assembly factor BamC